MTWRERPDADPEHVEAGLTPEFVSDYGARAFANRKLRMQSQELTLAMPGA